MTPLRGRSRHFFALPVAAMALFFVPPARAVTAEELQQQLAERDARIAELVRRIEALEAAARPAASRGAAGRDAPEAAPVARPARPASNPAPGALPGEETAEESARALERALVREGGLVLPRGTWELEPEIRYTHRTFQGLRLVNPDGQTVVADVDERHDTFETSLAIRAGLPWAMQAELRLPYLADRRNTAFIGDTTQRERASGFADVEASLTKQFLAESYRAPGLLGTLSYRAATGRAGPIGSLAPGAGYRTLQLSSTAVKRLDPMVFIGSLSYAWQGSRNEGTQTFDPGNVFGLELGSMLAASPETSLRFGLDLSRTRSARLSGVGLAGSDATLGLLELGVSTLLSPRTLLSVQTGIGLTSDAPDFQLTFALPFRF